jgi:hypothetical protein
MASEATSTFFEHLKSLFPAGAVSASSDGMLMNLCLAETKSSRQDGVVNNPWWLVAAVAFSAGNRPDFVALLFKHVLAELETTQAEFGVSGEKVHEERLLLARKFRECLFKGGMVAGYSKARFVFLTRVGLP